jgi:hypothetical protein
MICIEHGILRPSIAAPVQHKTKNTYRLPVDYYIVIVSLQFDVYRVYIDTRNMLLESLPHLDKRATFIR